MEKYMIFDNEGKTADRYTIINTATGLVSGSGVDPFHPQGIGVILAHELTGYKAVEAYVNEAEHNPEWLGKPVLRKDLPAKVQQFINMLDMDTFYEDFRERVIKLLPEYSFQPENKSFWSMYGTKDIPRENYRDRDRAWVMKDGLRRIYISSVMYKDDPARDSFRYCTILTSGKIRPYRHKRWIEWVEFDKVVITARTDEQMINELEKAIINDNL